MKEKKLGSVGGWKSRQLKKKVRLGWRLKIGKIERKKVRLGWRPEMKKKWKKKLLGITAIFGCLFTGKDRRSIHEWMNGWRQEMTQKWRQSLKMYKCQRPMFTSVPTMWRPKMKKNGKKKLLGIHKCELLGMTQLRIISYINLRIISYHLLRYLT